MKKTLMILGAILLVGLLFTIGTVAYGATTIDGLEEILQSGLRGLNSYFDFLLEVLKLIL